MHIIDIINILNVVLASEWFEFFSGMWLNFHIKLKFCLQMVIIKCYIFIFVIDFSL